MNQFSKEYNQLLEAVISIFTARKGRIEILLLRKKVDPYKGYWIIPGSMVGTNETIEDSITNAVYEKTGISSLYMEQCHIFSKLNRDPNVRIIASSFIGLIDSVTLELKCEDRDMFETRWFPITDLPKLAYDHENIINYSVNNLRNKIVSTNILKSLFPSDFTLPEIQKVYEQILSRQFDRRNFRKKFINMNLIEETGDNTMGMAGRPAKLYRFKSDMKSSILF